MKRMPGGNDLAGSGSARREMMAGTALIHVTPWSGHERPEVRCDGTGRRGRGGPGHQAGQQPDHFGVDVEQGERVEPRSSRARAGDARRRRGPRGAAGADATGITLGAPVVPDEAKTAPPPSGARAPCRRAHARCGTGADGRAVSARRRSSRGRAAGRRGSPSDTTRESRGARYGGGDGLGRTARVEGRRPATGGHDGQEEPREVERVGDGDAHRGAGGDRSTSSSRRSRTPTPCSRSRNDSLPGSLASVRYDGIAVEQRSWTGRARRWRSRARRRSAADCSWVSADISVHHPGVGVVLELDEVVRGVAQHEGPVHLGHPLEPGGDSSRNTGILRWTQGGGRCRSPRASPEGHAEVPRVEVQARRRRRPAARSDGTPPGHRRSRG